MGLERSAVLQCASDGRPMYGVWCHWKEPHVDEEVRGSKESATVHNAPEAWHRGISPSAAAMGWDGMLIGVCLCAAPPPAPPPPTTSRTRTADTSCQQTGAWHRIPLNVGNMCILPTLLQHHGTGRTTRHFEPRPSVPKARPCAGSPMTLGVLLSRSAASESRWCTMVQPRGGDLTQTTCPTLCVSVRPLRARP